jgi:DNA-binding MarR family transcriptional regulator
MNVQNVNGKVAGERNAYRSLMLLDEIAKGSPLSQRDLSRRLNIALGLVNSFLKNLVAKGYVKIKGIPSKRYVYYLTPRGFAEKSRLTYHYLHNYTSIYHNARKDYRKLFDRLSEQEIRRVAFAGVDMVAEIAYLSLQETSVILAGVVDDEKEGSDFFKHKVIGFDEISSIDCQGVVITTFSKVDQICRKLEQHKILKDAVWTIDEPGHTVPGTGDHPGA